MTDIVPRIAEDYISQFDGARREDEFGEWWSARDLMNLLGYSAWQMFSRVIDRAKLACVTSAQDLSSNFNETIKINSSRHKVPDYRLTRYAAYLVAMEAESGADRPAVAAAKTYFAVQTRKAEVLLDDLDDDLLQSVNALRHIQQLRNQQRQQALTIGMHEDQLAEHSKEIARHRLEMDEHKAAMRATLEQLGKRVDSVESITPLADKNHLYSAKEAAQLLGYGVIQFYRVLCEVGFAYQDSQQGGYKIYQKYMNQGLGEAKYTAWANGRGFSWAVHLTAKGVDRVQKLIKESQLLVG